MCDDTLIKQAQSGDATAFARLLEWVYDIIFRFAYKWAGNRVDAEDITQNACIKLASVIGQFRFESAFTSWLYRLVINCANDWRRKESRNQTYDPPPNRDSQTDTHTETMITSDQTSETETELTQVIKYVAAMGKDYKETLLLVCAEGLSHAEAAEALEVKESTISWRIHDIRKRLAALEPSHTTPNKENTHD